MKAHVKETTMKSMGTMTMTRRMIKRSICSGLFVWSSKARDVTVALVTHIRNAVIPLRLIALDVDEFPGKQRCGVRIHALHVRLFQPASAGGHQRHRGLRLKRQG